MIFEELAGTPDLHKLRLVSQQFEDLVVPSLYRHVALTPALVDTYVSVVKPLESQDWGHSPFPVSRRVPKLLDYTPLHHQMGLFTKHVTIDQKLDLTLVIELLKTLDCLQQIT